MAVGGGLCWRVVDTNGISPLMHDSFTLATRCSSMAEMGISVTGEQLVRLMMITWSGNVI